MKKAAFCALVAWISTAIVGSSVAVAQTASAEEIVVAVPGLRALHGDDDAAHELTGWLHARPEGFYRPYPTRRVNNLYFDRPDMAAGVVELDHVVLVERRGHQVPAPVEGHTLRPGQVGM